LTGLPAFHAWFGNKRSAADRSDRGTLNRAQPLDGAERLLGRRFPGANNDDACRGSDIALETA